ncbi:MAG: hypothetical protein HY270_00820 [Deltaproteobacteria bacterium]|nr:hypothetical protein [Deltaproteobacteria bacterium]
MRNDLGRDVGFMRRLDERLLYQPLGADHLDAGLQRFGTSAQLRTATFHQDPHAIVDFVAQRGQLTGSCETQVQHVARTEQKIASGLAHRLVPLRDLARTQAVLPQKACQYLPGLHDVTERLGSRGRNSMRLAFVMGCRSWTGVEKSKDESEKCDWRGVTVI